MRLPQPKPRRDDGLAVLLSLFLSLGSLPALWTVLTQLA